MLVEVRRQPWALVLTCHLVRDRVSCCLPLQFQAGLLTSFQGRLPVSASALATGELMFQRCCLQLWHGFSGFQLRSSPLYSKCFYPWSHFPSPQNGLGSLLFYTGSHSSLSYGACGPLDTGWGHLFSNPSLKGNASLSFGSSRLVTVLETDLLFSHKLSIPFAWPFCLLDCRL